MKNERFEKAISILNYSLENNTSMRKASKHFKVGKSYLGDVFDSLNIMLSTKRINKKQYDEYVYKFNKVKNNVKKLAKKDVSDEVDFTVDNEYDDKKSHSEEIRDKNKKIIGYKYKIYSKNGVLEGKLSITEMENIYKLYSSTQNCGIGLTTREISRCFPKLSFLDFKRILRVFNISKTSISVAPHDMEEKSEEELTTIMLQNKENNIIKKVEHQSNKYFEGQYANVVKELYKYKSSEKWCDDFINEILDARLKPKDYNLNIKPSKNTGGKPLYVMFADTHFGKKYDNPVFGRGYNKLIAAERMMEMAFKVVQESKIRKSSEIIFLFLGDMFESCLPDGIHSQHYKQMDIHDSDQIFYGVEIMEKMLIYVKKETSLSIDIQAVPGNHDRVMEDRQSDKDRFSFKLAFNFIKRDLKGLVNVYFSDNNLIRFEKDNLCFFGHHGDSIMAKQKPSDLVSLYGNSSKYTIIIQGHWHNFNVSEGNKFLNIKLPSICSPDKFIVEELGKNSLSGFLLCEESNHGLGIDLQKITLY